VSAEQVEPVRLRAELVRAEMELDIVKKAAAYFASESK
jgi:transposase-like protein